MTEERRKELIGEFEFVISQSRELLVEGDLTEVEFKDICRAASLSVIARAALTSMGEK